MGEYSDIYINLNILTLKEVVCTFSIMYFRNKPIKAISKKKHKWLVL